MNNHPIPFGIPNALFLYDDYPHPISVGGITYPSVRHAVLSFKTMVVKIKKEIAQTTLPSDLKDYELEMPAPRWWKKEFILGLGKILTLRKFKENPHLAEKLQATGETYLNDLPYSGQGDYGIKELTEVYNYRGNILMDVREILRKQKAP